MVQTTGIHQPEQVNWLRDWPLCERDFPILLRRKWWWVWGVGYERAEQILCRRVQSNQQDAWQTLETETWGTVRTGRTSGKRPVQENTSRKEGINWLPLLHAAVCRWLNLNKQMALCIEMQVLNWGGSKFQTFYFPLKPQRLPLSQKAYNENDEKRWREV